MAVPDSDVRHLDEHGFCVVRGLIDEDTAAQTRAMIDELLVTPAPTPKVVGKGECQSYRDGNLWPEVSAAEGGAPILLTGNYMHWLEHPIADPRTALTVPAQYPVMAQLLRSVDAEQTLKLLHQNFRRTDPSPPPYASEISPDGTLDGTNVGFHMDSAFLPRCARRGSGGSPPPPRELRPVPCCRHYETTPRQNYYITIIALSPVVSGGAAFLHAPGSLAAAKAAGSALSESVQTTITPRACRAELPAMVGQGVESSAVSDCRAVAQEVTMEVGDMLVLGETHAKKACAS